MVVGNEALLSGVAFAAPDPGGVPFDAFVGTVTYEGVDIRVVGHGKP